VGRDAEEVVLVEEVYDEEDDDYLEADDRMKEYYLIWEYGGPTWSQTTK
jgi:hypothetical protein